MRIDRRVTRRDSADQIVVFMPSAVPATAAIRHPRYARWSWAEHLPDTHIIAYADPALGMSEELRGAWFMHAERDLIREIARDVAQLAETWGVATSRILAYGSSLGGFGALALAAHLRGTHAIAEVPQIDFANWPISTSRAAIETHILGKSLEDHRIAHPEQVSLQSRFEREALVPPYLLVTNLGELAYSEQLAFHNWASTQKDLPRIGTQELLISNTCRGHSVFPLSKAVGLIRARQEEAAASHLG